jgi:hypothetical protein
MPHAHVTTSNDPSGSSSCSASMVLNDTLRAPALRARRSATASISGEKSMPRIVPPGWMRGAMVSAG